MMLLPPEHSNKETQQTQKGKGLLMGLNNSSTSHGILTIFLPQNNFSEQITKKWCAHWITSCHKNSFLNNTYLYLLDILGQNLSHVLPKSTELLVLYFIFWSDSS